MINFNDKAERQEFVQRMNDLLSTCRYGCPIEHVRIDEKDDPENHDGVTRLVISDGGMETRVNINANSIAATLAVFCGYVATGSCMGLYMKRGDMLW